MQPERRIGPRAAGSRSDSGLPVWRSDRGPRALHCTTAARATISTDTPSLFASPSQWPDGWPGR
eukprot:9172451-Lingulodinium_polyedra.AAC.1